MIKNHFFVIIVLLVFCIISCVSKPSNPMTQLVEESLTIDTSKWNSPKTYIGALYDYIVVVIVYNAETNEGIYYNFNSENAPYIEPFTVKNGIATSLNKRYGYYVTYEFNEGYRQLKFGNLVYFELGTESISKVIADTLNINNPIMDAALRDSKRLLEKNNR